MKNKLIILLIIAIAWKIFFIPGSVEYGPGVMAEDSPVQTTISTQTPFNSGKYQITPIAEFDIKAKVLSRKNYSFDREAELSPVDLALGWGRMSDEAVINDIKISQSNRWYRWRVDGYPIPREEIQTSSANMHMIPSNADVEDKIKQVRNGDIIHLKGKLVKVNSDEGFQWISSLTRSDTGSGACELIWVEQFEILTL